MTFNSQIIPERIAEIPAKQAVKSTSANIFKFSMFRKWNNRFVFDGRGGKGGQVSIVSKGPVLVFMGRLAKNEYDLILQNILINYELIGTFWLWLFESVLKHFIF